MQFAPDPKCPFCKTEGSIEVLQNVRQEFGGVEGVPIYIVEGLTSYHCTACGEMYVDPKMDQLDAPKILEARRRAEKLLTSDEITSILEKVPYSDKEIEAALGLGATSLSRWKAAKVCQSPAANSLLIAIGEDPGLVERIAEKRGISLSGKKRGRPPKSA